VDRTLSAAEIAESQETVAEFLPGLIPSIVRSDAFPDLYTSDSTPLVGFAPGSQRTYLATGFSGAGFKMASAFGAIAASEALGQPSGVGASTSCGPHVSSDRPNASSHDACQLPASRRAAGWPLRAVTMSTTRAALRSIWERTRSTAASRSPDSMAVRIS
jgi:hypothetical protein